MILRKCAAISVLTLSALSACSSGDGESNQIPNDTSALDPARAFINNGYYLSAIEEYESDGTLVSSLIYEIDYGENTITGKDMLLEGQPVSGVARYDAAGDYISAVNLNTDDPDLPIGTEVGVDVMTRESGFLTMIRLDVHAENEYDTSFSFSYNDDGSLSSLEMRVELEGVYEAAQILNCNYNNGRLVSLSVETPEPEVVLGFEWNDDGTLARKTSYDNDRVSVYYYDDHKNIISIELLESDGSIKSRKVMSYEMADEPVFNATNFILYYLFSE